MPKNRIRNDKKWPRIHFTYPLDLNPYKRVVEHYGPLYSVDGTVAFWQQIARMLNDVTQGKSHWSWNYAHQIYYEKIKPSARFMRAAMVLEHQIDSASPLAGAAEPLVAFTIAGRVKPGSIILGSSRNCERQGCKTSFVPVVPWQRFCCTGCRRQYHKELKS